MVFPRSAYSLNGVRQPTEIRAPIISISTNSRIMSEIARRCGARQWEMVKLSHRLLAKAFGVEAVAPSEFVVGFGIHEALLKSRRAGWTRCPRRVSHTHWKAAPTGSGLLLYCVSFQHSPFTRGHFLMDLITKGDPAQVIPGSRWLKNSGSNPGRISSRSARRAITVAEDKNR